MSKIQGHTMQRRAFIGSAMAAGVSTTTMFDAAGGLAMAAPKLKSLDPVNPNIYFGTTTSLWTVRDGDDKAHPHTIEWGVKRCAELGLQGIESYADMVEGYFSKPKALKKLFDDAGLVFIDCANGAKGQSTDFIDPAQIPKTIADHVAFARDFLQPMGCKVFKCNMGRRPEGGPSDDQLKRLSDTLNEIGRQTIAMDIKLAPHPHIWGPLEREKDMRRSYELTDPRYVFMTADLGHLVLGGGDPVQILKDYFPRVALIHLKDTYAKYRGNTVTPTQEQHRVASVYHNLGGGGVDFPAVFQVLRDRNYKGWAIFDCDGPRKGDDGFDAIGGTVNVQVDQYLAQNINYLRDVIGVKLPPAA